MTEEIIIDGVNVAGCNDFYKEWDNWSGKDNYRCQDYLSGICAGNNCYYKQLKRLEFELKITKADYEASEQENKELKEFCIELEKQKEKQHNQWFERCTENHNEDSKIIENYRSALEEIREIAAPRFVNGLNEEADLCNLAMDRIQNIINEVLK